MKYIEVERKYKVEDVAELRAKLIELGAELQKGEQQIDTYFNAPHKNFLDTPVVSEWFRLRVSGDDASLNFKRWLPIGEVEQTHCDEFETKINDSDAVLLMLEGLGFTEMVKVEKNRQEWILNDVLIALDSVENLGEFVEFEYKGLAADVETANAVLSDQISKIGIEFGERDRRGYPYQLLDRDR